MNKRYPSVALAVTALCVPCLLALCLLRHGPVARAQDPQQVPRPGGRIFTGAVVTVTGSDIDTLARKLQELKSCFSHVSRPAPPAGRSNKE